MDRIAEPLFTYALRDYLQDNVKGAGILALYAQPGLSAAVSVMHQQPDFPWTLASLAEREFRRLKLSPRQGNVCPA